MQRACLICTQPFELTKSGQRKYCFSCKRVAKLKRNRSYGQRHSKDWLRQYSQTPKRKQYLAQWKQTNPTWIRDYWRKRRLPKKLAKQFTKGYLTRLETNIVWQQ